MNYSQILSNFNTESLNEMQQATVEAFSSYNEITLISPTGSGKTLAFLLPLSSSFDKTKEGVQGMIIVPTRELAIQIEQVFKQMNTGFKINCCYGGHAVSIEKNNLKHAPTLLVGTPGRLSYHIEHKNIDVSNTSVLILDEFDKSLEAGFDDEMSFIIKQLQHLEKKILTSATTLKEIPPFVKIKNEFLLNFSPRNQQTLPTLLLKSVQVTGDDKLEALMLLIGKIGNKSTFVFCNHRDAVNRISEQLSIHKVDHGFYHGGLEQIDREKTLIKFRNGSINLLITTDLASRGLDIPEIEYIIHYQLPATLDSMMHRNGRTARMNASGTAYFILDEGDFLPHFLTSTPTKETLPSKFILPKPCEWKTLYIAAGKKDKINKMDIVGMLLQKGKLEKDELGKIEVLDHSAYAAIKRDKIEQTLQLIKEEKIKNRKIKMQIAS